MLAELPVEERSSEFSHNLTCIVLDQKQEKYYLLNNRDSVLCASIVLLIRYALDQPKWVRDTCTYQILILETLPT